MGILETLKNEKLSRKLEERDLIPWNSLFHILLSVPEQSEGTEVMKIAIRSDQVFWRSGNA